MTNLIGAIFVKLNCESSIKSRGYCKCGNLDVSQPYGPPWPVTGIALPLLTLLITDVSFFNMTECTLIIFPCFSSVVPEVSEIHSIQASAFGTILF
jgi:hypothetical protein